MNGGGLKMRLKRDDTLCDDVLTHDMKLRDKVNRGDDFGNKILSW